jgi:hypothetical protein
VLLPFSHDAQSSLEQPPVIDLARLLPATGLTRWSAREKAAVVLAVRNGTLRLSEAYDRYMLSEEELAQWEAAFDQEGIAGLRAKSLFSRAPS